MGARLKSKKSYPDDESTSFWKFEVGLEGNFLKRK